MAGRALDQGILVKLVIEDTQIAAIHKVTLKQPGEFKPLTTNFGSVRIAGLIKTDSWPRFSFLEGSRQWPASELADIVADCQKAAEAKEPGVWWREPNLEAARAGYVVQQLIERAILAYGKGEYFECEALAQRAVEVNANDVAPSILVEKAEPGRTAYIRKRSNTVTIDWPCPNQFSRGLA